MQCSAKMQELTLNGDMKVPCAKALSTSFTWVNSLYPRNRLLSYHRPHLNMKNLGHARLNNLSSHSVSEWDLKAAI